MIITQRHFISVGKLESKVSEHDKDIEMTFKVLQLPFLTRHC